MDKKQRKTWNFEREDKRKKEKKQNRKKSRILKTGLLGEFKREKPLKYQEIKNCLLGLSPKTKRTKTKSKKTKHQKKQKRKHLFVCWQTTPNFWQFLFFNLDSFISAKLYFAENAIEIVFSAEHSFCVSEIVKTPFEAPSPNGIFVTKSAIWGFPLCLLKPLLL